MEGTEHIFVARFLAFSRVSPTSAFWKINNLEHKIFGKLMIWGSFDGPKTRRNYMDPTWPFKQVIYVYIVQNKIMVIFLKLFKRGKFFLDDQYISLVYNVNKSKPDMLFLALMFFV